MTTALCIGCGVYKICLFLIHLYTIGVSQYTGISVYCNTEQNYIVSRYKSCIPVYCVYIFSRHQWVFSKTLIRNPVSSELLLFHKDLQTILVPPDRIMGYFVYILESIFQHADEFLCLFVSLSVIISHGNILQYVS